MVDLVLEAFPLSAAGQFGAAPEVPGRTMPTPVSTRSPRASEGSVGRAGGARNGLPLKGQPQKTNAISGGQSEPPSSQGKGQPRKF